MPDRLGREAPPRPAARWGRRSPALAQREGWRTRRRGIFAGLPQVAYRRTGRRYVDACAAGTVLHGVAVAGFGLIMLTLYVDLSGSS